MNNSTALIAIISALCGSSIPAFIALVKAFQERKRPKADLTNIAISSAEHALVMLREALREAEKEIAEIRKEREEERERHRLETLEKDRRISELENQLTHLADLLEEASRQLAELINRTKET